MKTLREIEELTEKAMNSIDNLQQAEANPYLYQKLRQRMLDERQEAISKNARLVLKISAALVLFMGVNVTSYYLLNKGQQVTIQKVKKPGINAVAQEYFQKDSAYSY